MVLSRSCEQCGQVFHAYPSRQKQRFCSIPCWAKRKGEKNAVTFQARFLEKIHRTGNCWLWMGSKGQDGYGHLTVDATKTYAHRAAYELFVGPIPTGKWVLHHCDNPSCVNPDHLFLGTNADNQRDSEAKGRGRGGERNKQHKLTLGQVQEIRGLYQRGSCEFGASALGRRYGVGTTEVCNIVHARTWKVGTNTRRTQRNGKTHSTTGSRNPTPIPAIFTGVWLLRTRSTLRHQSTACLEDSSRPKLEAESMMTVRRDSGE